MEKITLDFVIDRIKERHSLKSDYQVCKLIEISTALMSGWRVGKSLPDERMCNRLAQAAGIDPLVLAASMQSQRSKTEEARSLWAMVAERLQMVPQALAAAMFAVLFATSFIASDAHAQGAKQVSASVSAGDSSIHRIYQMLAARCAALRAWFQSLFSPLRPRPYAALRPQIAAIV